MKPMKSAERLNKAAEPRFEKPGKRRRGRPTLSNAELLDKALDLFLERGFEGTSIDAITAAAGMAKRTVYIRYGDKETLFKAALQHAIENWIVPIERLRAAETENLEQTMLEVAHILVANLISRSGVRLLKITNAESARRPDISTYTYERGTGSTIAYLADLFRRRVGHDSGSNQEWSQAGTAFLDLVVGGPPRMAAWGITLSDEAIKDHISYSVRLFLYGLLPRELSWSRGPQPKPSVLTQSADLETSRGPSGTTNYKDENRRLRDLLVSSMLEVASLKERLDGLQALAGSTGMSSR